MKKITKVNLFLAILAVVLAIVALILPQIRPSEVTSGWGDSTGGRPSYTLDEINSGALGDAIVFNSISDSTIGDEKYFVGAREYNGPNIEGISHTWNNSEIEVEDGQEYIIRAYIHNNSLYAENIAENVMVAFSIPTDSDTSIPVHGFITSDNAKPSKYWDGVTFTSNSSFHLEYIYGSALLENNGVGAGGLQLSDEIVTKASSGGVLIGYYDLDGQIPGCYQYSCYVTIRVIAIFDTDFRVTQHIRLKGDTEWHNYVDAEIGDEVEVQFQYQNIDRHDNTHENVSVRDVLPSNLEYVPGSTTIYTAKWPEGLSLDQDDLVADGIGIGNYVPGANAYIRFTVRVVDMNLVDEVTGLVNCSRASVNGITLQDFATVRVHKE